MPNQEKPVLEFSLKNFQVTGFAQHPVEDKRSIRADRIQFRISHRFKANPESDNVTVLLTVYATFGKTEKIDLGQISTETVFQLRPPEAIKRTDKEIKLPDGLLVTFLSISYSTTRGAFSVKTANSLLGKLPLPLINPEDIFRSSRSTSS